AALVHDPEEIGLRALLDLLARLDLHGRASGIGLHAAPSPAGAAGPVPLDDHVPDLTGRTAAEPLLAVEDQPAADPGAPPDAEHGLVRLAGPALDLAVGRDAAAAPGR